MHLVYSLSTLREMHALFQKMQKIYAFFITARGSTTAQMNDVPMTCELPVVVRRQ